MGRFVAGMVGTPYPADGPLRGMHLGKVAPPRGLLIAGIGQAFGNFTWNSPSQTSSVSFGGVLTAVTGNFTVTSTGTTGAIQLGNTAAGNLSIGGDFAQSGGNFAGTYTAGAARTITVGGDFSLTGGTFDLNGHSDLVGALVLNGGTVTTGVGTLSLGGSTSNGAAVVNGGILPPWMVALKDLNGNPTFVG